MNNFSVSTNTTNDIAVIIPKGYVNDIAAESLENTCEEFLGKGFRKIVINFSETQFINSIGASIFTGIVQKTSEFNSKLCFTNMKKVHRDIFEMLGITRHVKVFKDEKDAISFLKDKN